MFVNQSPKHLLRAISSFFSIISNSLNRRSIHNNRLIFLRKCPAASPAILPAVSTGSTFEIVALITKRLPVYRFIASASQPRNLVILLKSSCLRSSSAYLTNPSIPSSYSFPFQVIQMYLRKCRLCFSDFRQKLFLVYMPWRRNNYP